MSTPRKAGTRAKEAGHTGRHAIVLRPRKSKFVEIFRSTPTKTVCPNFYVLAHANGCGFAPLCTYCYLKSSFWHLKGQHAFTNRAKMLKEIGTWIRRDNLESYVLNAGNLSDSLSFEKFRPLVSDLVDLFRREAKGRPHTLLLVTKGGMKECRALLKLKSSPNVAITFSVNNPEAAAKHEAGAPPVADRLEAARRLKKNDWRIRIRIDPMIVGYEYGPLARQVKTLAPERLTLGTLRSEHNLTKFAKTPLLQALEQPSEPNALARYPLKERLKLYRQAVSLFDDRCHIGLCEETPDVWRTLGLNVDDKPCNCGG